jgi:hypothetical protein
LSVLLPAPSPALSLPVHVLPPSAVARPLTVACGACSAAAVRPLTLSENVMEKPMPCVGPIVVSSNRMSTTLAGLLSTAYTASLVAAPPPRLPWASTTWARSSVTCWPPVSTPGWAVRAAIHVLPPSIVCTPLTLAPGAAIAAAGSSLTPSANVKVTSIVPPAFSALPPSAMVAPAGPAVSTVYAALHALPEPAWPFRSCTLARSTPTTLPVHSPLSLAVSVAVQVLPPSPLATFEMLACGAEIADRGSSRTACVNVNVALIVWFASRAVPSRAMASVLAIPATA